jgi:hypothetical protein
MRSSTRHALCAAAGRGRVPAGGGDPSHPRRTGRSRGGRRRHRRRPGRAPGAQGGRLRPSRSGRSATGGRRHGLRDRLGHQGAHRAPARGHGAQGGGRALGPGRQVPPCRHQDSHAGRPSDHARGPRDAHLGAAVHDRAGGDHGAAVRIPVRIHAAGPSRVGVLESRLLAVGRGPGVPGRHRFRAPVADPGAGTAQAAEHRRHGVARDEGEARGRARRQPAAGAVPLRAAGLLAHGRRGRAGLDRRRPVAPARGGSGL